VTFGFHKGVIFPGNEGPIQAGDSILIVLFADTVDRDKVIEFISNAPNLGHEAILNDPDLNKAPIFMFGFKIGHDTSTRNHALPARKRRGVDLSQSAKRQAIAEPELVFSWYRNHNPLNNTNLSIGETTVQMIASNLITSTVLGEIENQTVKLRVSGGAVALVARRGKVKARNLVSSRQRYESYSIIPLCEQPAEKVLKAHPGDLVFMFVPLTANNNLETLKVVPGLVQNIEANWNPFIKQCCKDQVAVAVFSVKAQ
jgi:ribosomal protein L28